MCIFYEATQGLSDFQETCDEGYEKVYILERLQKMARIQKIPQGNH